MNRSRSKERRAGKPQRATVPPVASTVDEALVRELTASIRRIGAARDLEQMLEVGRLLYERCYTGGGDNPTINAIAEQPDVGMSRTGLYRAVEVYLQHRAMPVDIRDNLTLSQHYGLTTLDDDPVARDRIARDAVEQKLPAAAVKEQVRASLEQSAPRQALGARIPPIAAATRLLAPWKTRVVSGRPPSAAEAERILADIADLEALLADLRAWASDD